MPSVLERAGGCRECGGRGWDTSDGRTAGRHRSAPPLLFCSHRDCCRRHTDFGFQINGSFFFPPRERRNPSSTRLTDSDGWLAAGQGKNRTQPPSTPPALSHPHTQTHWPQLDHVLPVPMPPPPPPPRPVSHRQPAPPMPISVKHRQLPAAAATVAAVATLSYFSTELSFIKIKQFWEMELITQYLITFGRIWRPFSATR